LSQPKTQGPAGVGSSAAPAGCRRKSPDKELR
jgi:hypothetical protein